MTRELTFRKFVVGLQYPLSSRISSSIYTKGWVKLNFSKTLSAQKPSWPCYTRTCSNHSQDSVDEFIHPVLKMFIWCNFSSFDFSDPYIRKEALQTPVIVHWSVSRQMTPRHWKSNFLGCYWINSGASSCKQKEKESKISSLVSSVEMEITEQVTSWKNIYLIRIIYDIVTRWWWGKFSLKCPHS